MVFFDRPDILRQPRQEVRLVRMLVKRQKIDAERFEPLPHGSTVPKVLTQDLDLNFSGGVDGFKQLFERCLIQIVSIAPKGMLNRANIPSREFYGLIVRHRYLPRPSVMIAVGNSRVSVIVGSYRE